MRPIDPAAARALIAQAGLEDVFASYPDDVMVALEQAAKYNEAIGALDIKRRVPGASRLPEADQ